MIEAWIVWLVLAAAVLVLELVAVFSGRRGDTISESVWWLLKHGFGVALVPFYLWLGWHFFIEFWFLPEMSATHIDDLLLIIGSGLITAIWQRKRSRRR